MRRRPKQSRTKCRDGGGSDTSYLWKLVHSLREREEGDIFICYINYSRYSDMMESTTIQVNTNIRDMLRTFGRKGETYNDIITKLIERARYVEFMEENYRILETEDNWVSLDAL